MQTKGQQKGSECIQQYNRAVRFFFCLFSLTFQLMSLPEVAEDLLLQCGRNNFLLDHCECQMRAQVIEGVQKKNWHPVAKTGAGSGCTSLISPDQGSSCLHISVLWYKDNICHYMFYFLCNGDGTQLQLSHMQGVILINVQCCSQNFVYMGKLTISTELSIQF